VSIPDEVIRYAIGRFGKPNVPIDPNVDGSHRLAAAHARVAHGARDGRGRGVCAVESARSCPTGSSCCGPPCRRGWWMPCGPAGSRGAGAMTHRRKPIMSLIRQLTARRDCGADFGTKGGIESRAQAKFAKRAADAMTNSEGSRCATDPLSPVKGFLFDLDGTLLLSDRALAGL